LRRLFWLSDSVDFARIVDADREVASAAASMAPFCAKYRDLEKPRVIAIATYS
jgi:hypothetical protein